MPLIDHFLQFSGLAAFHIGEIDSQNSGCGQLEFAAGRIRSLPFVRPPRLVFHEGRGHSLRTGEPTMGPMDESAKALLVREAEEMLGEG